MKFDVGIDLVENKRLLKHLNSDDFLKRILSSKELEYFYNIKNSDRKLQYLCGRYAAKEAIFKCTPKQETKTNFNEISILKEEDGKPFVEFKKVNYEYKISISNTENYSVAYVMIIKQD